MSRNLFRKLYDLSRDARVTPGWARYTVGAALTLVPVFSRIVLHDPFIGTQFPLVVFCPGIFMGAWLFGPGPGLVATFLSAVWADYLWFEHAYTFQLKDAGEAVALAFLILTGSLICLLVEMFRQTQLLTDRRVAESNERSARLQALINDAPIGIALLDRDLRFLDLNEYTARATGIPKQKHLGRTLSELIA